MAHQKNPSLSLYSLNEIEQFIQEELQQSRQKIQNNLGTELPFIKEVLPYILNQQKQLLRSMVLILSANLFIDADEKVSDIASVLEYLNIAAVLHQKIILTEEFRRQQKEFTNIWGNEASILLGDYLLSISFQIMTSLENLDLIEVIAATTKSIARGQVISISEFSWDQAEAHYLQTIEHQKVSLYVAAAKCGGILGNADPEVLDHLTKYGFNLGMAIQLGKDLSHLTNPISLSARLMKNQTFFPLSYVMQKLDEQGQSEELKEILSTGKITEKQIHEIIAYFKQFHVQQYTQSRLYHYIQQAESSLNPLSYLKTNLLISLVQNL